MGTYVEVADKRKWLNDNALEYSAFPPKEHYDAARDAYWVCLINNGPFYAAGITYSQRELEAFSWANDFRPKTWYLVGLDLLETVSNVRSYLKG